ncbi:Electron transfer flavoprotein subunit beta [Trichinella nelsoni]|uniref:Electron transfer flavoprotein subunit beta n=1 Tax=Trichinella nelsoni TaxID=6336 RepID=A0A0V0S522_9BILA|nr:Electron transfer flavoprotein subunit beta [Trichinella nelsoni]
MQCKDNIGYKHLTVIVSCGNGRSKFVCPSFSVISVLMLQLIGRQVKHMSLRVLVSVKRVIDYAVKIRVKNDKSGVVTEGVKHSINPFDEIALEEAIRMKEQKHAAEVIAVSCGPPSSQDILRHALALGVDKAIHVEVDAKQYEHVEPLHVAKILQCIVKEEDVNLVMLGKQAIDDDCNQTGQMLSALLNWSQAIFASKVEINAPDYVTVTREIDGGLETVRCKLPSVITADLRLNTPRYATLPNIMKAKKKPLVKKNLAELGITIKPHKQIIEVSEPPPRKVGQLVGSVQELVDKLRSDGLIN